MSVRYLISSGFLVFPGLHPAPEQAMLRRKAESPLASLNRRDIGKGAGMATMLVVDDDRKLIDMLRRTLAYEGYRVVTAVDGHEALDKARRHKPDLVVLDWMLPGMDGIE